MTNGINVNPLCNKDKIFIDTNILIFLFSPTFVESEKWQIDKYSEIFLNLIENKNKLYINSVVISEFINQCLRIDFNKHYNTSGTKDFKRNYRKSDEYKNTLRIILNQLKKILKKTIKIDDNFSKFDTIEEYKISINIDFNDLIIAKTVIDNDFKLLTNDGDFKDYPNIQLVSA